MKNLSLLKILIILIVLISCNEKRKMIVVNTHNADGFTTESKLDVNGIEIGTVIKMELIKDGTVNLTCEIENNEIEIPIDSKFYAKELGLLGNKIIGIEIGTEKKLIETEALIKMSTKKPNEIDDKFSKAINEVMSVFSGQHKTDSLLYGLRRLNMNIEKLELKKEKN